MNAIKLFLAALVALVSFPALATDPPAVTAGVGGWIIMPKDGGGYSCRRTVINPAAVEQWKALRVEKIAPTIQPDDSCPTNTLQGHIIAFYGLGEGYAEEVTIGDGIFLYPDGMAAFRRDLHTSMEATKW